MICCKISTNFNNMSGDFNKLINEFNKHGEIFCNGDLLFFSDTCGKSNITTVKTILKKSGYMDYFVLEYDKNNIPHESDDINVWLADKLIKINYQLCEIENQKAFHDISHGLDLLDQEIKIIKQNQQKESKSDN